MPRGTRSPLMFVMLAPLAALLVAACEPTARDVVAPGPQPATIAIEAPVSEIAVGDSVQFTSLVLDTNGDTLTDATVQWSSLSPWIASVSASGRVLARIQGTSRIVAAVGKLRDTVHVTVAPACSTVLPEGGLPLESSVTLPITGVSCVRAGEARFVRGYYLVVPTEYQLQLGMSPVTFGDSILITTAAGTERIAGASPRITGSGGTYYLLLNFTTSLSAGSYIVWVLRDGAPTPASATLSVRANALCRGATINRSLAVLDSIVSGHTSNSCLMDGTYAEGWEFSTADTSGVSFSLLLNALNIPHLVLADSAMNSMMRVVSYSDNLMLDAIVPPGNWRLWVTSNPPFPLYPSGLLSPPSGFPFRLTRNAAPAQCGLATTPIVVGAPISGTLGSTDCVVGGPGDPQARADLFTFTIAAEATLDFSLAGSFPLAHFLRASNDSIVMIEYNSSGTSMVTRKSLVAGTYTYIVRPASTGTSGTYSASITEP